MDKRTTTTDILSESLLRRFSRSIFQHRQKLIDEPRFALQRRLNLAREFSKARIIERDIAKLPRLYAFVELIGMPLKVQQMNGGITLADSFTVKLQV